MPKERYDKKVKKIFTIIAVVVIIAIIILISEISKINKNKVDLQIENNNNANVSVQNIIENDKKELSFNTFVDKIYTTEELENMTESRLRSLLENQLKFLKENDLEWKRIVGSANTAEEAKVLVAENFKSENQFVTKLNVVEENEIYYVIDLNWKNVTQSSTKNYNQKVLVLNSFFYNTETNVLNLDDSEKSKYVLDLYNYTKNYNNNKKHMVQTFIEKKGKTWEYILYYAEVNYNTDTAEKTMNWVKEITYINAETGELFDKSSEIIKEKILLN